MIRSWIDAILDDLIRLRRTFRCSCENWSSGLLEAAVTEGVVSYQFA